MASYVRTSAVSQVLFQSEMLLSLGYMPSLFVGYNHIGVTIEEVSSIVKQQLHTIQTASFGSSHQRSLEEMAKRGSGDSTHDILILYLDCLIKTGYFDITVQQVTDKNHHLHPSFHSSYLIHFYTCHWC